MNDFVTEEQQVEALKKWWSENGNYLMGGVVIGLGVLFGWDYYKDQKVEHGTEASALMFEMTQSLDGGDSDKAVSTLASLEDDFDDTPYAAMANLRLASNLVNDNKLDEASERLAWVIKYSDKPELVEIATLRQIRIQIAQQQFDEALSALEDDMPNSYAATVEELRGDAYSGKGEQESARKSYDRAILAAGGSAEFVQLKRDALGEPSGDAS